MIQTGDDIADARKRLGWSVYTLARALRLAGDRETTATRVRQMERGAREIGGPTTVAVEAFLTGFRPEGFDPDE